MTYVHNCFLCRRHGTDQSAWFDEPLRIRTGVGSMVASVGALRSGFVLLSPAHHVPSVAALHTRASSEFKEFCAEMLANLKERYGDLTFWEHGGIESAARTSACVDHAHITVIPGIFDLEIDGAERNVNYVDIWAWWNDTDDWSTQAYLMHGNTAGHCTVAPDLGISQYFRRSVAAALGKPDEWDYAACPNYAGVRQTIDDWLD